MSTGGSSGKGKNPVRAQEWPSTREEFVKWFWSGRNGNDLIKELNKSEFHGDDYIRREKERPTVYCIVLNDSTFPGKDGNVEWKLCNVGFTHYNNTARGTGNRMEQVQAEVERKYNDSKRGVRKARAAVLFRLPVGAVDTTTFSDTEKRIRNAVGLPLHKDVAKKLNLSCSRGWVLTTQQFIDMIKAKIKEPKGSADPIDLFKDLKFNPPKEPSWVKLDHVNGLPTVTDLTEQD